MTTSRKKNAAPAAATAGTAKTDTLGEGSMATNTTALDKLKDAWGEKCIDLDYRHMEGPSLYEKAWGEDQDLVPAWAVNIKPQGAVSDFATTTEQKYPAAHQKQTGELRTYLVQPATMRFPMVAVDIFQDGNNVEKRNRTGASIPALRLYPWEVAPLLEALKGASDLANLYVDQVHEALAASPAMQQLPEDE